ncbi:hypothetical protein [Methanoregula sp.]|uniref:hypothetical protein n=1 Tax=Methanoregula sp. TaxID=2052170 RepID=UPI003BB0A830
MAGILAAGCTNTASTNAPLTPTPEIIYVTVTPSPVATVVATLPTPQVTPVPSLATSGIPAADPILHRWIRQYGDPTAPQSTGYEFKFYPDGTVDYREGTTKEVSSNIIIDTTYNFSEETGTWTSLGNMTYLVKVLPTGQSGAQIIREYTLVPAHQNPDFPGITVPAQIESSYETNLIGANTNEQPNANLMYYPEQAEID